MNEKITIEMSVAEFRRLVRDEIDAALRRYNLPKPDAAVKLQAVPDVKMYSLKEVAQMTGLSLVYIRLLEREGQLKTVRFGKAVRVTAEELEAFLHRGADAVRHKDVA